MSKITVSITLQPETIKELRARRKDKGQGISWLLETAYVRAKGAGLI